MPVNLVVVVSKGHQPRGRGNTGAVGVDGLSEYGVVGDIGDAALEALYQAGVVAVTAPRTGVAISRPGAPSRFSFVAEIMARYPEARVAFIDLHCNAFGDERARGTETFASSPASKSLPLASLINANVVDAFRALDRDWVDRGVKFNNFLVFSRAAARVNGVKGADFDVRYYAALVEFGFITNPNDALVLETRAGVPAAGRAVAAGVVEWAKLNA
jgi:N-acetylmuramoyl-L-alanine amidase